MTAIAHTHITAQRNNILPRRWPKRTVYFNHIHGCVCIWELKSDLPVNLVVRSSSRFIQVLCDARGTIEFANEIYCSTWKGNRFLFFSLAPSRPYISLSLIKHVNLCCRREFLLVFTRRVRAHKYIHTHSERKRGE